MRLQRVRRGHDPRRVRARRVALGKKRGTLHIRARGLARGRYRLVVVAINAAGARSAPKALALRVR